MSNVFRVIKDKNYTVISNEYLRDKNLRLESIGLMTIILSLSSDYKITMDSLLKLTKENYRTIKLILKELKSNGYVEINKQRDEKGHYYFDYIFFESNKLNPLHTFCKMDNVNNSNIKSNEISNIPSSTLPPVKNNEDYINTNNKKINIDKTKLNLCFLTEYLIDWDFIKLNNIDLFGYDNFLTNFIKENDDIRQVISVVNYVVKKIKDSNYRDESNNPITNLLSYFKESCRHNLACMKARSDPHLFDDWL